MTIRRFAVVLTHNRPAELAKCVTAIGPQVDQIVIVDNASDPPVSFDALEVHDSTHIIHDAEQPPNLARLMNRGLDWVAKASYETGTHRWDVALLCDDVFVPDGWFAAVADCVRAHSVAAGSTHQVRSVATPLVKTVPDRDIFNRMQGSACVFRGELALRADENMHWWWQDTDLDWQARLAGGTVICPGPIAVNTRPNDFTVSVPGLAECAGRDGEYFHQKWATYGGRPW